MPDPSRLEDLRRRVQKDPASIAFAQLAEECRRAGRFEEAVDVSMAGLQRHPGYTSARVTLGRALLALNRLDEAHAHLMQALQTVPDNLSALRTLAEVHRRRGNLPQALVQYRAAATLAPNDPDLERMIGRLTRELEPPVSPSRPTSFGGTLTTTSASRAVHMIAALERWLAAIHVTRAERHP